MARDIRACLEAGIRPSVLLFNGQPGDWTDADRRLLRAYQTLKDESCSHCGHPIWLCRSEGVEWAVHTDTCFADRALGQWREAQEKADKPDRPGRHPYVVPYTLGFDEEGKSFEDKDNLPSRSDYFK